MVNVAYNGIVTLNRGDSLILTIPLRMGTPIRPIPFEMTPESFLYFALMEPNQPFESAIVKKKLDIDDVTLDGKVRIKLNPQDTQCLLPGRYYYQVKLQIVDAEDTSKYSVHTIIDKTLFYITE